MFLPLSAPQRHQRFLVSFGIGLVLGLVFWLIFGLSAVQSAILGFDAFAAIFLGLSFVLLARLSSIDLRRRSEDQDEGMAVIMLLMALAISVSLWAIVAVLNGQGGGTFITACALLAIPLGWAVMQLVAAFHYAHLFFLPHAGAPLQFPGAQSPAPWDFVYFSLTIGMTAQVSDVEVKSSRLRRAVMVHSVAAFFTNTVILALAVNAGLKLI
jgi:uncharacterized membrane protein